MIPSVCGLPSYFPNSSASDKQFYNLMVSKFFRINKVAKK